MKGADQPLRREPQVRVLWRVSLGLKRSGDSGISGAGVGEDRVQTGFPLGALRRLEMAKGLLRMGRQSRQVGLLWIRGLWVLFGRPILGRVVVSLGSQPGGMRSGGAPPPRATMQTHLRGQGGVTIDCGVEPWCVGTPIRMWPCTAGQRRCWRIWNGKCRRSWTISPRRSSLPRTISRPSSACLMCWRASVRTRRSAEQSEQPCMRATGSQMSLLLSMPWEGKVNSLQSRSTWTFRMSSRRSCWRSRVAWQSRARRIFVFSLVGSMTMLVWEKPCKFWTPRRSRSSKRARTASWQPRRSMGTLVQRLTMTWLTRTSSLRSQRRTWMRRRHWCFWRRTHRRGGPGARISSSRQLERRIVVILTTGPRVLRGQRHIAGCLSLNSRRWPGAATAVRRVTGRRSATVPTGPEVLLRSRRRARAMPLFSWGLRRRLSSRVVFWACKALLRMPIFLF